MSIAYSPLRSPKPLPSAMYLEQCLLLDIRFIKPPLKTEGFTGAGWVFGFPV